MATTEQYDHACNRIRRVVQELDGTLDVRFYQEKQPAVVSFEFRDGQGKVIAVSGDHSTAHLLSLGKQQMRKLLLQLIRQGA